MKKFALAAALAALTLAGCEGTTEDEIKVFRLKSVAISDGTAQTGRSDYRYTGSGRLEKIVTFSGAGTDTLWGTLDDVIGYWSECTFTGSAVGVYRDLSVEYNGVPLVPAALADWNALMPREPSCVDGLAGYSVTGERIFEGPGTDGIWLTSDDLEDSYRYGLVQTSTSRTTWSWTTPGASPVTRTRQFTYETTGSQGTGGLRSIHVIEDANNAEPYDFEGRYLYFFDSNGRLEERVLVDNKGTDGIWGTGDDLVHSRVTLERIGGVTKVRSFDLNDDQTDYYEYTVVSGRLATETRHKPGPDGDYETADDELTVYTFTYEEI